MTALQPRSVALGVATGLALSWLWRELAALWHAQAPRPVGPFSIESCLSLVARAKKPALLRGLLPLMKIEGMAAMAGGTPHESTFPVKAYTLELRDGETIKIDDPKAVAKAQQYMHDVTPGLGTIGYLPLLEWIRGHVREQHSPPNGEWACCVCTGNSDGFQRAWEALLDPGDTLLVDELNFAFSTSQLAAWTGGRGLRLEPLPLGPHGLDAAALHSLLDSWALLRPGVRRPKALFTIPAYQNPTCVCLDLATAHEVYAACATHGLVIIEDDPYRYLAFGDATDSDGPLPGTAPAELPPSFLSVDTDARVVRCDTFSKWIGPGLRCGFVTAPKPLIQKLAQGTGPSLGVASSVQVLLHAMLERWGPAGLDRHVRHVQAAYRHRCTVALRAARLHLDGLARWEAPLGGMFMWIELLGVTDAAALLDVMTEQRVCVVPGSYFSALATPKPSPYVRVSFAYPSDEVLVEGFRRLATVLRKHATA